MTIEPAVDTEDGWTLVEVLVSLSLLSLLIGLLTIAIGSSRSSFGIVERRSDHARSEFVAFHLRSVLKEARLVRPADQASEGPLWLASSAALQIVSSYSPAGQYAGLYKVELYVVQRGQTDLFDLFEARSLYRPTGPGAGSAPPVQRISTLLLPNITSVRFTYFGAADGGAVPTWSESWTSPDRVPQLVHVAVAFPGGDRRPWQDVIVEIPAATR